MKITPRVPFQIEAAPRGGFFAEQCLRIHHKTPKKMASGRGLVGGLADGKTSRLARVLEGELPALIVAIKSTTRGRGAASDDDSVGRGAAQLYKDLYRLDKELCGKIVCARERFSDTRTIALLRDGGAAAVVVGAA